MIGLSLIPDVALAVVGVVLAAIVRVVWGIHGRLSKLEGDRNGRRPHR